ncbi:hypothetical protein NG797_15205 [Laspinema sp. D5]|nr:hypothetical protein [Laspinema sp. D3d]
MTITDPYLVIAQSYADGVRALLAPSVVDTGERGGQSPSAPQDLTKQAENLSLLSKALTQAIAEHLTDARKLNVRTQASVRLLAKARTDLEISAYLYQAALDEEEKIFLPGSHETERSLADLGTIEENLRVLLDELEISSRVAERGETELTDIPTARGELSNTVKDTLAVILERASQSGQSALGRLMGLGATELAQAVGFVGMDIAELLGQAERVNRIYNAFRDFLHRAYESVMELLGRQLAQTSAEQVIEWVNELNQGKKLNTILEKFYGTQSTFQDLQKLVEMSPSQLEQFITAIQNVNGLDSAYRQQISWAEKLLQSLRWFGTLSTAVLPQGKLVLAAIYITLGSYVILVGADYVDSPNQAFLDCVPGVRRVVENNLNAI